MPTESLPERPKRILRKKRPALTWGDYYYRSLNRGDDHGYAAYYADTAMKRRKAEATR